MRNGFKFAIIIDDAMEVNYTNLYKLNAFNYIIIHKKLKYYNEIMEDKVLLKNIIEI